MKMLDLGCGRNKIPGSFGVDFAKYPGADFLWDLNKMLPKRFHKRFDIVYSKCAIDHLGNPFLFLQGCGKYLKSKGRLILIADNGDYWRFHLHLGCYHATLWDKDAPGYPETHHKMLFQKEHLLKMLRLAGFRVLSAKYFRDYKFPRGHIDYLLPEHLGKNMLRIEAQKDG